MVVAESSADYCGKVREARFSAISFPQEGGDLRITAGSKIWPSKNGSFAFGKVREARFSALPAQTPGFPCGKVCGKGADYCGKVREGLWKIPPLLRRGLGRGQIPSGMGLGLRNEAGRFLR